MQDALKPMRQLPSERDASGRTFDDEEMRLLKQVMDSGTLNSPFGTVVKEFEKAAATKFGAEFAKAVSSGTAAVHTAVAAIDPEPGDEIITTPVTDMGAIAPILYQTAIPVFADIDPDTFNVTAETIEPKISSRTRAIIATSLFGNPCDMDAIMALGVKHGIPVIEDAAQAYLAEYKGRTIGTIGQIGCFSLAQTKHIGCGEGGFVIANDPDYVDRLSLFPEKAWGYGDSGPDHAFLSLNYRMTELQGAVALAQLPKVDAVVESRIRNAQQLNRLLESVEGISPPRTTPNGKHSYWRYSIKADPQIIQGGIMALAKRLQSQGVLCFPRYIQKPAFMCQLFQEQRTFGNSGFPFVGPHRDGDPVTYRMEDYPGTTEALANIGVMPWNDRFTFEDVEQIAERISTVASELRKKTSRLVAVT